MRYRAVISNLKDLILISIEVNDKLYELALKKKYDYRKKGSFRGLVSTYRGYKAIVRFSNRGRNYDTPLLDYIELDNLIRIVGKSKK